MEQRCYLSTYDEIIKSEYVDEQAATVKTFDHYGSQYIILNITTHEVIAWLLLLQKLGTILFLHRWLRSCRHRFYLGLFPALSYSALSSDGSNE